MVHCGEDGRIALPAASGLQADVDLPRVACTRACASGHACGCVAQEPRSAERVDGHRDFLLLACALPERPTAAEQREAPALRLHDRDVDGIAVTGGTAQSYLRVELAGVANCALCEILTLVGTGSALAMPGSTSEAATAAKARSDRPMIDVDMIPHLSWSKDWFRVRRYDRPLTNRSRVAWVSASGNRVPP